ncbi:uncharacterized protein LOC134675368 [Cydia fagiglandana]
MTIAHLSRNALGHKYICFDHFEKRFIQKEDGIRKRLNKLGVPVHYKGDQSTENFPDSPVASTSEGQGPTEFKVLTPKKVYPGVKNREENEDEGDLYDTELFTTPKKRKRPADSDTPNCKRLKTAIEDTKKMLKKERMKYRRLQKKIQNKKFINLSATKFKSDASKVLTQMQLRKSNKQQWTEAEKKFCVAVCADHNCASCGSEVDSLGHHGLACSSGAGRLSRHSALNDILRRALVSAGVPAALEPQIVRNDGKRPDGMSLIPWKMGRALVWDATCADTLAASYVPSTSGRAGAASDTRERLKCIQVHL